MRPYTTSLLMVLTDLFDRLRATSRLGHRYATSGDIDRFTFEMDNRDRLLNVITQLQKALDAHLEANSPLSEELDLIKTFAYDFSKVISEIQNLDQISLDHLELMKEETTKEIGTIFSSKESFKGYNLNNVKR